MPCRRSAAAGAAGRSRDPRRAGLSARCAHRACRCRGRQARHLRHRGGSPETGYGYIQRGAPDGAAYRHRALRREAEPAEAREFVGAGDYYWNSGMFLFRARRYLEELTRFAPEMARVCAAAFRPRRRIWISRASTRRPSPPARRFDRLRGHGKDRGCRGGAAGCRLERCRLLGVAARGQRCGCATAT